MQLDTHKRCPRCHVLRSMSQFSYHGKWHKTCSECASSYWKDWYIRNKEIKTRHNAERLALYKEKSGIYPKRPWQPSEIDFLYESQGKLTILQMAEKLGRSWSSVQRKLNRLNGTRNEVDSLQGEVKTYRAVVTSSDTLSQEDLDRGRRMLESGGEFKKLKVKNGCDN